MIRADVYGDFLTNDANTVGTALTAQNLQRCFKGNATWIAGTLTGLSIGRSQSYGRYTRHDNIWVPRPGQPAVTNAIDTAVTTDASTYGSGAFTPGNGDLLVILVMVTGSAGTSPSMTDSSPQNLGFTLAGTVLKNASADAIYVFVSNAPTHSTDTETLTFHTSGAVTATGCIMKVIRVSGCTKFGAAAVRQIASQANQASGGTPAPVFATAPLTTNVIISGVANETNPAGVTKPASFTLGNSGGYSTPTSGGIYAYQNNGFTSTTVTWGSTSASAFGSVAIEIDTSAAGYFFHRSRQSRSLAINHADTGMTIIGYPYNQSATRGSAGVYITCGPEPGGSFATYDYMLWGDPGGGYSGAKLISDTATGYYFCIESNPGGVVTLSNHINVQPGETYWVNLWVDFTAGLTKMAVWRHDGLFVGSVSSTTATTGLTVSNITLGQNEAGVSAGTVSYMEDFVLDVTNAVFPIRPLMKYPPLWSSATGNVTVAATGNALTASAGTVSITGAANVTSTGTSLAASVGNVSVSGAANVAAAGNSLTASAGNVSITGSAKVSATGNALAASAGTVSITGSANIAATGTSLTASVGTVTVSTGGNVTATGNLLTASVGNVTVTAGNPGTVNYVSTFGARNFVTQDVGHGIGV